MQKIDVTSTEALSADIVAGNIQQIRELFPELITEGSNGVSVNVDVLKALVGDKTVTDADEKYGLNWYGKRCARQLALTPSTGTLRPCKEESKDWDTTQNLMIEGDNLEVLKLLQKSYAGKVKLIYIDPPYNTGKDFVYPDNFQDNIKNYLDLTGQVKGGQKISSNTETSGRFHTNWLNMMYPRLKLARNLLRNDGVIAISIDDGELDSVRKLCIEIFGEENFIAQIIWRKRSTPPNDKILGTNHDYIVCYAKSVSEVRLNLRERSEEQVGRYRNPDNHPKGYWASGDLMANVKGGRYVKSLYFGIRNPKTGDEHFPGNNGNWRFSKETIERLLNANEIYFGENGCGKPKLKRFLCDVKYGVTYPTIWDFVPLNTDGSREMLELFGNATIFESPKPVGLIQELVKIGSEVDSVVMDFFAGAGSSAHAVMVQNASDCGKRKFIVVQLPEPTPAESEAGRAGFKSISALTSERLRRAAAKINANNPMFSGDTGFRVFKLDTSNIRAWNPNPDNLEDTLFAHQDHLVEGRTELDVLYELLLKLGLDLCVPIEQRTVAAKDVHAVGGGVLMACLAPTISRNEVESLTQGIVDWHKELAPAGDTTCVFRDSAFADDVAKTNLAAILEQAGISNIRSL